MGLAILCGVVFICLFYVAQQQVFKGKGRTIFEAFLMLIASYFVTLLAILMLKYKGYEQKWQAKLEKASNQQVSHGNPTTHASSRCSRHKGACLTSVCSKAVSGLMPLR